MVRFRSRFNYGEENSDNVENTLLVKEDEIVTIRSCIKDKYTDIYEVTVETTTRQIHFSLNVFTQLFEEINIGE